MMDYRKTEKHIQYRSSILVNKVLKILIGVALFLGLSLSAKAQTSLTGRVDVGPAAQRPVTCTSGDVYVDSDDNNSFRCASSPPNTWITFGGGLNSPITSPNPLV